MLEDYVGRSKIEHDEASPSLCRRVAALLGYDADEVLARGELPFPWAAMLFPTLAPQQQLGPDGHPLRGDFLPPVPLPRRRFAGRSVELHQSVRIGDPLSRTSTIASITSKEGRSGPLVFVTIEHIIAGSQGLCHVERQDVVYLGEAASGGGRAAGSGAPVLPEPAWSEPFITDEVMLFRYSALTFNGHRIHYDRDYATKVEGYPGLVVNGGLTTLRLLEMARHRLATPIASYNVRAIKPLFVGAAASLHGAEQKDGHTAVWCLDGEGGLVMRIDLRAAGFPYPPR